VADVSSDTGDGRAGFDPRDDDGEPGPGGNTDRASGPSGTTRSEEDRSGPANDEDASATPAPGARRYSVHV